MVSDKEWQQRAEEMSLLEEETKVANNLSENS
jgi:hypothetical protein